MLALTEQRGFLSASFVLLLVLFAAAGAGAASAQAGAAGSAELTTAPPGRVEQAAGHRRWVGGWVRGVVVVWAGGYLLGMPQCECKALVGLSQLIISGECLNAFLPSICLRILSLLP